jgi:hypothetical protein
MGRGLPNNGLTGHMRALNDRGRIACDGVGVGLGIGLLWEEENGNFWR